MDASGMYLEYDFTVEPRDPGAEILIAELAEVGFESFVETDAGVTAYIQKADWYEEILNGVPLLSRPGFRISLTQKQLDRENWNVDWERNFDPIQVGDQCRVRAPFHPASGVQYEIVIEPKMSFGTGHHETTYMMLRLLLDADLTGASVLDMGCGTGVLAILVRMKGAASVDAVDNDNWCYLNATENVERNGFPEIQVHEGDAGFLKGRRYDVILANINRNILLQDLPLYREAIKKGGTVYLSGFYSEDLPAITQKCAELGLRYEKNEEKNNWVAVKYVFCADDIL